MKGNTNKMARLHYYEFYELKHEKQGEHSTQAFTELTALQSSQLMVCQISFNTEGAEFVAPGFPVPLAGSFAFCRGFTQEGSVLSVG